MSQTTAAVISWAGPSTAKASQKRMRISERSDEELMLACRDGDSNALAELFRRYKDRIYSFAYRMLGNEARAEDVLQETFLRVHASAGNWQPNAKFSSWAFRIARNLCVDDKRKYWNRQVISESQTSNEDGYSIMSMFSTTDPGPRSSTEDGDTADKIRAAIEALSPEQQEVMVLSKYHNMSYPEIAEVLGVSQESVKQRAYRAHMKLRSSLRPLLEEQSIR